MAPETESETTSAGPARPNLFVEATGPQPLDGADAVICAAPAEAAEVPSDLGVIWRWSPGCQVPPQARVCVAEGGLEAAADLRDRAPSLAVVPRIEVQRAARSYGFAQHSGGSGFATYHLDPATARGDMVRDSGQEMPLADWLAQAAGQGFAEVWLHSTDAAAAGHGFSADLLKRAHRDAPAMGFWLSGGASGPGDIDRVAALPGLVALVVPQAALALVCPSAAADGVDTSTASNVPGLA